jgi:hypothetical protein
MQYNKRYVCIEKRRAMRHLLRLMAVLLVAMLVLASCGGSDDQANSGEPTAARATRTVRPTATEEEEEEPTATRRRATRPTPTADEDEDGGPIVPGELETISSFAGDFTLDCPNNWKVDVDEEALRCLHPREEVIAQVNTSDLGTSMDSDELAERTNEEFKKSFGKNYVEDGMEPQSDGSVRIDFEVTANEEHGTPDLVGRAFVEEHDETFYLFMILIEAEKVEEHNDIVEEIIDSFAIESAR